MTTEEKAALVALCRIEVKRWKAAAEAVPERKYMVELMEMAHAALTLDLVAVPKGWRLVPVEPTDEQWQAAHGMFDVQRVYRAMIAAAPTP